MATTWLIITGILLLVVGIVLRTILMMRSSDATPREARVLHGRELLQQYRQLFPQSSAPRLMQAVLIGGAVLLVTGVAAQLAH
jgi:hypothetical protein